MSTELPNSIFNHPETSEHPRFLFPRPQRSEVINRFNSVYNRMQTRAGHIQDRFDRGDFAGLAGIASRTREGEMLSESETNLTAIRIDGQPNDGGMTPGTDFSERLGILNSCLTPEERSDRANVAVERIRNPHWYDGLIDALGQVKNYIPSISLSFR